ncbi:MAG: hypothetical protein HYS81_04750 [Candidatus Aenigmatarchaeota archaeon]|nr:MAG: hypothetical protein HYS81_04750 [Candidatus Aenigmarchaeota archaeon]
MKLYLTHCSAKKDDSLRDTVKAVGPDALYTATPTQRFMERCRSQGVRWAILSDLHGVWFPDVSHAWYEKDPNSVSVAEFVALVEDFNAKLAPFDEVIFYNNPGRFHPLYKRLVAESGLRDRVRFITHLAEIV